MLQQTVLEINENSGCHFAKYPPVTKLLVMLKRRLQTADHADCADCADHADCAD